MRISKTGRLMAEKMLSILAGVEAQSAAELRIAVNHGEFGALNCPEARKALRWLAYHGLIGYQRARPVGWRITSGGRAYLSGAIRI